MAAIVNTYNTWRDKSIRKILKDFVVKYLDSKINFKFKNKNIKTNLKYRNLNNGSNN